MTVLTAEAPAATPAYVIEPQPIPALPVRGTRSLFPVHRIYCVGRNYAEHAIEMGHDPNREPPFFFQKNPDNLRLDGEFPYPAVTKDVHFEIEMVVALGRGGKDIPLDAAMDCVYGYGVGLDMTRRDLQGEMKKLGLLRTHHCEQLGCDGLVVDAARERGMGQDD